MKFIIVCVGLVISALSSVYAFANDVWNFEKHPQLTFREMTSEEQALFDPLYKRGLSVEESCYLRVESEYLAYLKRYPEYQDVFDEKQRLRKWRDHMAQNPAVQETTCLYNSIGDELKALNASRDIGDDFMFCGKYTREPQNADEARVKELFDELITYIGYGSVDALSIFWETSILTNIKVTPDEVNYYFARIVDNNNPKPDENVKSSMAYSSKYLTPERIAFLDGVAKRQDHQALQETLPPCFRAMKKFGRPGWGN